MVSMPSLRAACVQVQRSLHAHRYGHESRVYMNMCVYI